MIKGKDCKMTIIIEEKYHVEIFITCDGDNCINYLEIKQDKPIYCLFDELEKRNWTQEYGMDSDRFFCEQCSEDRAPEPLD
jgi:hypothetical protein